MRTSAYLPSVESFVDYGHAFQKALVGNLENRRVSAIESSELGLALRFEDGGHCRARFVVVATGIGHFPTIPRGPVGASANLLSHSSAHHDLSAFKGRKVAVIGAGSSAADVAGLLHLAGANTHLISRRPINSADGCSCRGPFTSACAGLPLSSGPA